MKTIHIGVVAASALAILLLAPFAVTAKPHGGGSGARTLHFRSHLHSGRLHSGGHRSTFGQWPLYGGVVAVPPYVSDNTISYAAPTTIVYVPEPPRALSCRRSQETVTVPSEQGGMSKITITRC